MDAHRDCPTCSGKTVVWMYGNEIYRVTARKDQFHEVEEFICNECRFEKKDVNDWIIEGPRKIDRTSVISVNHYENVKRAAVINPIKKKIEKESDK
jgi:NADH-quinone oxidoreductase subunit G